MKHITVSEATFDRLKRLAEPLEDTADSIIGKLLDVYEGNGQLSERESRFLGSRTFDPLDAPTLTHTKILSASFCGRALAPANWNRLLDEALREAKRRLGNFDSVRRIAMVNIVDGRKEDEGYHFLEDAGLSVQGQDANAAWRGAIHIARHLQCPVEVDFVWRAKEGAAHPGESGRFEFDPRTTRDGSARGGRTLGGLLAEHARAGRSGLPDDERPFSSSRPLGADFT